MRIIFFIHSLVIAYDHKYLHLYFILVSHLNWTLRKVNAKYLEMFEMWCWGSKEKISWTDRLKNEEVLL